VWSSVITRDRFARSRALSRWSATAGHSSSCDIALGLHRFDQLLDSLGVASNVLSDRLNRLVAKGILERVPYSDRPPRFEYRLTEKGASSAFPCLRPCNGETATSLTGHRGSRAGEVTDLLGATGGLQRWQPFYGRDVAAFMTDGLAARGLTADFVGEDLGLVRRCPPRGRRRASDRDLRRA
jgi:hypothetical protein